MRWSSIVSAAHLVLLGIGPSRAIPNVKKSIIGRAPNQPAKEVYRGDFRSPAQVAKDGGFRPRGDYANEDRAFYVYRHVVGEFARDDDSDLSDDDDDEWSSAFVSVTTDMRTGASYGHWLYLIHATPNMIDPTTVDDLEPEIFALGGVPWSQVMGWWYQVSPDEIDALHANAVTTPGFTPNPAYRGGYDELAVTTVQPTSPWRSRDRGYWTLFMQHVGSAQMANIKHSCRHRRKLKFLHPNQTMSDPIQEADEQIRAIIERLQRAEAPSTCQLVGECSGISFSQKKRKAAPAELSSLCQKIHRPRKGANGLDKVTQNSEKCVLRSSIKVKVQLSDATSAGSWDRLFLVIGHNPRYDASQPHYLLKESPDAGDLMSMDVDLADAYTMKKLTINDIKTVRLVSRLDNGGASNQLKLQDITITAKCAASSKVAELHKTVDAWFTNWGTDLKPADWSWKKDCNKFESLQFKWHLGSAVRGGTVADDDIALAQSPAAGDSGRMKINLKETYGSASVPIEMVDYFRVYSTTKNPDSSEDEWEFGGIKFTAQCEGYDRAVVLDKYASDYNWHSRSNGVDMPIAAGDWRWEDADLQTRHPFPREEL